MGCNGCGREDDEYVIKTWGGGTVAVLIEHNCRCPLPGCFACRKPLDDEGRCQTTLCFMDGLLVPIPELIPRFPIISGEAEVYG